MAGGVGRGDFGKGEKRRGMMRNGDRGNFGLLGKIRQRRVLGPAGFLIEEIPLLAFFLGVGEGGGGDVGIGDLRFSPFC